jgi:hypothetical protein
MPATIAAAVKADPAVRQLVADFEAASKTCAELRQAMTAVRREWLPDSQFHRHRAPPNLRKSVHSGTPLYFAEDRRA